MTDHSRRTTYLLAASCSLIVANIYYSQTLVGPISSSLGMSRESSGLIVTLTQLGYCLGLLLLVPLADLLENRRLSVLMTLGCALALLLQGSATSPAMFLLSCSLVGLGSVTAQVLVPLAAHLAPEGRQGREVGTVMSGLMLGIMLSRPLASAITQLAGWRAVFWISSALALGTAALMARTLPRRQPTGSSTYLQLLGSLARLYVSTPILLERGLYQGFMFGAFSIFWTAVPLYLASPALGLDQGQIALFALVGVAGVVVAPLAGAQADKGRLVQVTTAAMTTASACFLLTLLPWSGRAEILLLLLAAIGIDAGATANLVVSQREVFSLNPEFRSRLNGLFISTFFVGGALGSGLGAWAYARGGWEMTASYGATLPALALALFFVLESLRRRRQR